MQQRALIHGLLRFVLALIFLGVLPGVLGCAAEPNPLDARALRRQFPQQADEVLRGHAAFAATDDGFEAEVPVGAGELTDVGVMRALDGLRDLLSRRTLRGGLRARLPKRGDSALRLELLDGFEVRVRELDASGDGALAEDAVAYAREGGTSFWVATESGFEEWLLLGASAVRRDAPVAAWEVEGATLRRRGDVVEIADARGAARLRVTAPLAYAAGGRSVEAHLGARGPRIELWVSAEGESLLVDPAWVPVEQSMSRARTSHTATLLKDGRVLIAGGLDGSEHLSSAELFDPVSQTWTPTTPMRFARFGHTATRLNDSRVLVAGGRGPSRSLSTAELFDPESQTWTTTAPMGAGRFNHAATLLSDGRALVSGGSDSMPNSLSSAELFDPESQTWAGTAPMGSVRALHTATRLTDGRVLVTGGSDGSAEALSSAELFHPESQTWSTAAPMANARAVHTATQLEDGRVLVSGGWTSDTEASAETELFDPRTELWTHATPMSTPRVGHTATPLKDGHVLVAGGYTFVDFFAIAELFDPRTELWTPTTPMNHARAQHTATLLDDGRVLVAGGNDFMASLSSAELFVPPPRLWTTTTQMHAAIVGHTVTPLADGRVLVAGGEGDAGFLASAALFEPQSETWTSTTPMSSSRTGHTATLLDDGRVLVAGGEGDAGFLAGATLFEPQSETWTSTTPMSSYRTGHTATLLDDGRVLVAGGIVGGILDRPSAELFDPRSRTWTLTTPMNTARTGHTATLLSDGRVLVAGGIRRMGPPSIPDPFNSPGSSSAELFDPQSRVWTPTTSMNAARVGHTATLLKDGRVLVTGDSIHTDGTSESFSAELFDPRSQAWIPTPSMARSHQYHTATLLSNDCVLVAGGPILRPSSSNVELFDPRAETWTVTQPMVIARQVHSAAMLNDGRVLVVGGSDGQARVSSAELFGLLPAGADCSTRCECQSGSCVDGVCCDRTCDAFLCEACSRRRGAVADGTCTPLHPECSPFACAPQTGECAKPCGSVNDCARGYACDLSGNCVSSPSDNSFLDDSSCNLPPQVEGSAHRRPLELGILLLTALVTVRRRGSCPRRKHTT